MKKVFSCLILIALSFSLLAQNDAVSFDYKVDNAFFQRAFTRTYLDQNGTQKFGLEIIGGNPGGKNLKTGDFLYSINGEKAVEGPFGMGLIGGLVAGFRPVNFYDKPYTYFDDNVEYTDSIYEDVISRTSAHIGLSFNNLPLGSRLFIGTAFTYGKNTVHTYDVDPNNSEILHISSDKIKEYKFGFTPYFYFDNAYEDIVFSKISMLLNKDFKGIASYALNFALKFWDMKFGYSTEVLSDAAGKNYLSMYYLRKYVEGTELFVFKYGQAFDYSIHDKLSFEEQKETVNNQFVAAEFSYGLKAGLCYKFEDKKLGWRAGFGIKMKEVGQGFEFGLDFMKNYITEDLYGGFENMGFTTRFVLIFGLE